MRSRIRDRFRLPRLRRDAAQSPPQPERSSPLRGLGEPPAAAARDDAGEAELDTLRGDLVRELDRIAEGDDGSGSFRRVAS